MQIFVYCIKRYDGVTFLKYSTEKDKLDFSKKCVCHTILTYTIFTEVQCILPH